MAVNYAEDEREDGDVTECLSRHSPDSDEHNDSSAAAARCIAPCAACTLDSRFATGGPGAGDAGAGGS